MIALDRTDILDVLEHRRIVEKATAGLVAEKAGEKELAAFQAACRKTTCWKGNEHFFARAELDFRLALVRATGKPRRHQGERYLQKHAERVDE